MYFVSSAIKGLLHKHHVCNTNVHVCRICVLCTCRVRHVLLPLMMVVVSDPAGQRAHDVERMRILRTYMFATYALCLCTSRCCCFELVCTFGTLVHLLCAVCCTRCCLTAAASKVIHYDYTLYDRVARGKTSACACVSSTYVWYSMCSRRIFETLYTIYTAIINMVQGVCSFPFHTYTHTLGSAARQLGNTADVLPETTAHRTCACARTRVHRVCASRMSSMYRTKERDGRRLFDCVRVPGSKNGRATLSLPLKGAASGDNNYKHNRTAAATTRTTTMRHMVHMVYARDRAYECN